MLMMGFLLHKVFIDEVDAITPTRKDGGEELSKRLVATLLNLMDGIGRNEGLFVIAATNRLDLIEPALRRPGRFDKEIEIGKNCGPVYFFFNFVILLIQLF